MSWETPLIQSDRAASRTRCSWRNHRRTASQASPSTLPSASRKQTSTQTGAWRSVSVFMATSCFHTLPLGDPTTSRPSSRTQLWTG